MTDIRAIVVYSLPLYFSVYKYLHLSEYRLLDSVREHYLYHFCSVLYAQACIRRARGLRVV